MSRGKQQNLQSSGGAIEEGTESRGSGVKTRSRGPGIASLKNN